jgi:hypothetical protein
MLSMNFILIIVAKKLGISTYRSGINAFFLSSLMIVDVLQYCITEFAVEMITTISAHGSIIVCGKLFGKARLDVFRVGDEQSTLIVNRKLDNTSVMYSARRSRRGGRDGR